MSLRFKANTKSGDYKPVPPGSHVAVCNLIVDLGLQPASDPHDEPRREVYLRFETPQQRNEHTRDGQGYEPLMIGSTYTASMHEKAKLRQHLEGWRGKRFFSDEEAERFDVASILGKACMLTVVENAKGTKVYSNIAGISPLPAGVSAPHAETQLLLHCAGHTADLNMLPEWLQKKIGNRIEEVEAVAVNVDGGTLEITDDDIPF
jgi:hypothetical protein